MSSEITTIVVLVLQAVCVTTFPIANVVIGVTHNGECGGNLSEQLGITPEWLLVVIGSIGMGMFPIIVIGCLARLFKSVGIILFCALISFSVNLGFLCVTGMMLFPTATVACYGSGTFKLLLANFVVGLLMMHGIISSHANVSSE